MSDFQKILVAAVIGAALSGVGTFAAMQRQVDRVEVRQEEQYKAVMTRIDDVGSRTRQGHDEIRMDLDGIRREIMALFKERRR